MKNNIDKKPTRILGRMSRTLRKGLLLALVQCMLVPALYAQDAKVTINVRNSKLENVFREIQKQSGYKIFYSNNTVDVDRQVTISMRNVTVADLLKRMLPQLGLTYKFIDNTIVLSRAQESAQTEARPSNVVPVRRVSGSCATRRGLRSSV